MATPDIKGLITDTTRFLLDLDPKHAIQLSGDDARDMARIYLSPVIHAVCERVTERESPCVALVCHADDCVDESVKERMGAGLVPYTVTIPSFDVSVGLEKLEADPKKYMRFLHVSIESARVMSRFLTGFPPTVLAALSEPLSGRTLVVLANGVEPSRARMGWLSRPWSGSKGRAS